MSLLKTIEHRHLKPLLRRMRPHRETAYAGVRVSYKPHLDGGGSTFGQDFVPVLRRRGMPKVARAFEWCAGPGFIGFSLLAHGLCETLCLADVNPQAVAACRRTVDENHLADRVSVYESNNLTDIPPSEQWNLVVSNPPHFIDDFDEAWTLRAYDKDWNIHRRFFAAVGKFLAPDGVIVLQENGRGSTVESFRDMIEQSGLTIVFVHGAKPELTVENNFYYIGIMRRGDTPPAWASGPTA